MQIQQPSTNTMITTPSSHQEAPLTCLCPCQDSIPVPSTPQSNSTTQSLLTYLSTNTPPLTYLAYLLGTLFIMKFLYSEYTFMLHKTRTVDTHILPFTTHELFWYRLDHHFSSSQYAKPIVLLGTTFVVILVGANMLSWASYSDSIIGNNNDNNNNNFPMSLESSTWLAWTYVADPGTHADAEGFWVRIVSFWITLGGMLIFALMIGIISDAIGEKVDDLKKGKSRVIESGHTLILGWSDKSLAIIQEIALANESEGGGTIVILAEEEKEDMERMLRTAVESNDHPLCLLGTEVVFRSGNPLLENDLRHVSMITARAIIALSPDGLDPDEADSRMVRQVLSLKAFEGLESHVVVEMQDIDNKDLVHLVAKDFVEVVVAHDVIGRLMIQCAREPGLAYVLENLISFEGSEFYIQKWPELTGRTFLDITCRFDDAVPVGIKTSEGEIIINPGNRYVLREGDSIMVIAEDNDSYSPNDGVAQSRVLSLCGCADGRSASMRKLASSPQKKEKMLFCGWRRDMADMIMQLDEYVNPGSELWLFNTVPPEQRQELLKDKGNKDDLELKNLTIQNVLGNPIVRRDLRKLEALDSNGKATGDVITLDEFDSLLILADAVAIENGADMPSLDSRSLASLLIIHDIQRQIVAEKQDHADAASKRDGLPKKLIEAPCDPISEILDTRTRSLLQVANCTGYVMSNQIVSAVITQIAEDRTMNKVLTELLSASGCETCIRDASLYVDLDKDCVKSFWDVCVQARQRREVAIGYKPRGVDFGKAVDLLLNPKEKDVARRWEEGDKVIVFATHRRNFVRSMSMAYGLRGDSSSYSFADLEDEN